MSLSLKPLLLLLLATALLACSPSRSFTKQGKKLATAGLHDEASLAFMQALGHDRANIDARVGLRLSGQQALNTYLDRFFRAHGQQQYKESVYAYRKADQFYVSVTALNIDLEFPPYYKQNYEEDLAIYLEGMYVEGQGHLKAKRFTEAEALFNEINTLRPGYKDVGNLKMMSKIIPAYEAGQLAFEAEQYRKAYNQFNDVFALNPNHEDVAALRRVAKERATLTIAVMPFENSLSYAYATNITSFVVSELSKANIEFLVLIDREHTDKIIKEQKFNLAFGSDEGSSMRVGELMGAKLILTGRLLDLGIINPELQQKEKTGYESYIEKVYNAEKKRTENITRYRKVMYTEFGGASSVRMKVQYQLINAETGKILLSDVFVEAERDEVAYISYDGNARNLFAGVWRSRNEIHSSDRVYQSFAEKRKVDELLSGKRDFRPMNNMLIDVQGRISSKLTQQVVQYEIQRGQ
jgi:tetratricopeptide (TPR) repeat protein